MKHVQIPSCLECKNKNKLFCGINTSDREYLSQHKKSNLFQGGQVIFEKGSQPNGLYCIYKGCVKLTKLGADGKEQIVRLYRKGEVLGYKSLLRDTAYDDTATAIEDSEICHISKNAFMDRLRKNNHLAYNVIQLLSDNLKESEDKLISVTQKSVKERVAQALLLLTTRFGLEEDNATIPVVLTRREIGEIACITTETTIRALSELKKDKILELNQKKIKIIDMERLVLIASMDT